MDKLTQYRRLIESTIRASRYFIHGSQGPNMETQFLCDETNGHYLLLDIGWTDKSRVFRTILYLRIKNGKIWIEEDWTEEGITDELLRAGVPKEDIVLAFHHPSLRPLTDFAVA